MESDENPVILLVLWEHSDTVVGRQAHWPAFLAHPALGTGSHHSISMDHIQGFVPYHLCTSRVQCISLWKYICSTENGRTANDLVAKEGGTENVYLEQKCSTVEGLTRDTRVARMDGQPEKTKVGYRDFI